MGNTPKNDRAVYDRRYAEKRKNKTVSFNTHSPTEKRLFELAAAMPNFSEWVKEKLKELENGKK